MTETETQALNAVMATEGDVQAKAEAFAALPRATRRAIYFSIPDEAVRKAARAIVEARRGVSRTETGDIVLTDEALVAKRDRLTAKIAETESTRLPAWKAEVEAINVQIQERGIEANQA